ISVNICICTCSREELLFECLQSLDTALVPDDISVSVSVIDNAPDQGAKQVVERYNRSGMFEVAYRVEERRGIPFARNRAIACTEALNSDYLIFIDDDEWVTPEWLGAMFRLSRQKGGDAVISGAVRSIIPKEVPGHISYFFTREKGGRTGDKLQACATNNVLIPMQVITRHGLRVDEANPLAGGTDTIFFVQAVAFGVGIYKCMEAVVYERVPLARANLRWLSKRKYRVGVTEAWRKRHKGRSRVEIFLSSTTSLLAQFAICVLAVAAHQKRQRNKAWLRVSKSAGVVMGLFGRQVDSYRDIEK